MITATTTTVYAVQRRSDGTFYFATAIWTSNPLSFFSSESSVARFIAISKLDADIVPYTLTQKVVS